MTALRRLALQLLLATMIGATGIPALAQSDDEQLKITALEALMSAPSERALPIVTKVLEGNSSDELKERALFVLGQIDRPEAHQMLADFVKNGEGELRLEAIRMIGISGNKASLVNLAEIYADGDGETREAVLEAYLIADDSDAVYRIAASTDDPEEFENAVEMLGAMGAREELRTLRNRPGMEEFLIEAYAVAGDVESLTELAMNSSNPERQAEAIRGLGVAGGDDVAGRLADIYRKSDADDVREAALEGLLIADADETVLELFRASSDRKEKQELLEMLVIMDSEAVWDIIDATFENGQ